MNLIVALKGAIQSPHCAANCLQHVRSSGLGATVCKSRATHRALITCNMYVVCHDTHPHIPSTSPIYTCTLQSYLKALTVLADEGVDVVPKEQAVAADSPPLTATRHVQHHAASACGQVLPRFPWCPVGVGGGRACKTQCTVVVMIYDGVVCWLLNVPATCECISGTDLLRQFYVLPH